MALLYRVDAVPKLRPPAGDRRSHIEASSSSSKAVNLPRKCQADTGQMSAPRGGEALTAGRHVHAALRSVIEDEEDLVG